MVTVLAGSGLHARAESVAQAGSTLLLPELVVSASRTEVDPRAVGSAVTVITAEEIERRQVRMVADLLRQVPGVAVNRTGGMAGLTQVRIRGAEANHTLVVIDGVEANDPLSGSEFDFSSLLTDDIERIEILRGPQSAIWGSDAIGGVINIVTKRGRPGYRAHAAAEAGSFGTYRLRAGVAGGTERMRGSVSGMFHDSDGFDISGRGAPDGYRNSTLNATGDVDVSEQFTFGVNGRYTRIRGETDPQDFAWPDTPTQGLIIDGDEHYRAEHLFGRAQARLRLFDGAWEQTLGTGYTQVDRNNYAAGNRTSRTRGAKTKLDYQSTLRFDTPDIAGADHALTFYAEREREDYRNRNTGTPAANQNRGTTNYGYVGEYRVGLWEQLFLSGAVRFDDNDGFRNATTWRTTAAYVIPEAGTRIRASYGTGFTKPTFFELFGFNPNTFAGNPDLKAERSKG
ncbi:MAG: TonB-dependent receptor plug domain-containing protein, partial [Alphaproteobacteria bacterium]